MMKHLIAHKSLGFLKNMVFLLICPNNKQGKHCIVGLSNRFPLGVKERALSLDLKHKKKSLPVKVRFAQPVK